MIGVGTLAAGPVSLVRGVVVEPAESVTELLERENELAVLLDALARARAGRGCLAVLRGEAGAGKSSLANAFVAVAGVPATWSWCDPIVPPRAMGAVLDMAADLRLARPDDPFALFDAVLTELRTETRVVVVEDVHWADSGTIDFLRHVGRRIGSTPSLLVVTVRDDELDDTHPVWSVVGELTQRDAVAAVDVPALSLDAIRELLAGSDRDPARVAAVTGGNAFFVSELLGSEAEVPVSVSAAVLARLARLARRRPSARSVVEAVALAPRGLGIGEALRLAEGDGGDATADVDAAVTSGVLFDDAGTLRFRHDLARSAVESSLPPARRAAGHHHMLDVLVELGADPGRLAHHALRSGDAAAIRDHVVAAAHHANAALARRQAAELFEAALDHPEAFTADEVADLRVQLSGVLRVLNRPAEALDQAELAVRHRRSGHDPVALGVALTARSACRWEDNDRTGCRVDIDEAVELLSPRDPDDELLTALARSASYWMLARRRDPAQAEMARYRAICAAVGQEPSQAARMDEAAIELCMGSADEGLRQLDALVEETRRSGEVALRIGVLGYIGSGGGEVRRYGPALAALDAGLALAAARDADSWASYHEAWLGRIAFEQGRWDDAAAIAQRPRTILRYAESTAQGVLGRVRVRRGDPHAEETLRRAIDRGRDGEVQHVWSAVCGLAELAWLENRVDDVIDLLVPFAERVAETDSEWGRGEVAFWQWRCGLAPMGGRLAEPFALQIEGDWASAAEAWRRIGCPYEEATALLDGDADAIGRAITIVDELGGRPLGTIARSRLRALGRTPPALPRRTTAANPAGLTARQLDVVALMVEGLDNGDIAARLHLSKKTVEHHVSAVFAKLGVEARAAAIAEAIRIGVATP